MCINSSGVLGEEAASPLPTSKGVGGAVECCKVPQRGLWQSPGSSMIFLCFELMLLRY